MPVRKPDIVLIQPPGWAKHTPPLGLALLKSYLAGQGMNARIFDLNIILYNLRHGIYAGAWELSNGYYTWERESYIKQMFAYYSYEILYFIRSVLSLQPKAIGFSVHSSSVISASFLASKIKQISPQTKIIFGGPQVADYTNSWKTLLEGGCGDAVIFGEGESSLSELLKIDISNCDLPIEGAAYKNFKGWIIKGALREQIRVLDSLPFADFSDFDLKSYSGVNVLPTYFSRGCINKCIYCTENKFFPKFRSRSGQRVFDEIMHQLSLYPATKYFRLHDSISNGDIRELEKLCGLLIGHKIKIGFNLENAVVRKEMNRDLYRKLRKAGCNIIGFGLENPSKELLHSVGKLVCADADFDRVVKEGVGAKITISINMMFGLPGETGEDYKSQLDFIKRHRRDRKLMLINPALNFCYFPSGSDGYMNPEKYGIDLSKGELYWSEKSGRNTLPERLAKFEEFCSLADRLGYKNIFDLSQNSNRNELLGSYYYKKGSYLQALRYFKESFELEFPTVELIDEMLDIYDKLALPKDAVYESLIKYRSENADACRRWINSPENLEELNKYIAGVSLGDASSRFGGFAQIFRPPKIKLSPESFKKYIKYLNSWLYSPPNKKMLFYYREFAKKYSCAQYHG